MSAELVGEAVFEGERQDGDLEGGADEVVACVHCILQQLFPVLHGKDVLWCGVVVVEKQGFIWWL